MVEYDSNEDKLSWNYTFKIGGIIQFYKNKKL